MFSYAVRDAHAAALDTTLGIMTICEVFRFKSKHLRVEKEMVTCSSTLAWKTP